MGTALVCIINKNRQTSINIEPLFVIVLQNDSVSSIFRLRGNYFTRNLISFGTIVLDAAKCNILQLVRNESIEHKLYIMTNGRVKRVETV